MPTVPTGLSFISYRRSRISEGERLVASLRERGIPTWRDVDDLNTEPTERELRRVLDAANTANAILWITPETAESAMIKEVEAPVAITRHRRNDGFFIVPVAAGGLDYPEAAAALNTGHSFVDIGSWNIIKLQSDPADDADLRKVANQVLKQRLEVINYWLPPDAPIRITLNTRQAVERTDESALSIDWSHRFGGMQNRTATAADWQNRLLPALADIRNAIRHNVPGRSILASGQLALPAATALGNCFMATAGMYLAWEQRMRDSGSQVWSLSAPREESGFHSETLDGSVTGANLAVMVSVNNDVSNAVAASADITGPFRAYVQIKRNDSAQSATLKSPGQASDLAHMVIEEVRKARLEYSISGRIHLFTAVPAGLAMMVGQLLNTLGPVQTYEHIPSDAIGRYTPAALLNAG